MPVLAPFRQPKAFDDRTEIEREIMWHMVTHSCCNIKTIKYPTKNVDGCALRGYRWRLGERGGGCCRWCLDVRPNINYPGG